MKRGQRGGGNESSERVGGVAVCSSVAMLHALCMDELMYRV